MKTRQDPPSGYGYGHVEHRTKQHIVKWEDYNTTALCGVNVRLESMVELSHGTEREVCDACLRKHRTTAAVEPPKPTMKVRCAWCGRGMGEKPCAPEQAGLVSHDKCEACDRRDV